MTTIKEKKYNSISIPQKKILQKNNEIQREMFNQIDAKKEQQEQKLAKQKLRAQQFNEIQNIMNEDHEEYKEYTGAKDREHISMQILRNGFIQSYIDFFLITDEKQSDNIKLKLTEDKLAQLSSELTNAEESTKYSYPDKSDAIEKYFELAEKFFGEYQDYKIAAYFYKRVQQISKQSDNYIMEGRSKLGQARCYDCLNQTGEAIEILEKSIEQAQKNQVTQIVEITAKELMSIYQKVAESFDKGENDIDKALSYYEKCLNVSKNSGKTDDGQIQHKIGLLYFKSNNYSRAIEFQKKYLELNSNPQNNEGKQRQMEAHASLAKCYLKLNLNEDAKTHLLKYLAIADNFQLNNAQSDAALHLATLCAKQGKMEESLDYYQKHFNSARTEKQKDRKLVDKARVTYGIALANSKFDQYIKIVANSDKNLKALLDWKSAQKK